MLLVYAAAAAVTLAGTALGLKYANVYISEKGEEGEKKPLSLKASAFVILLCLAFNMLSVYVMSLGNEEPIHIIEYATAVCGLMISSVTDIRLKLIPNKVCLAMALLWAAETGIGCIFLGSDILMELISSFIGALFGGGILLLGRLLSRNGMGMGDVKLLAATGLLIKFDMMLGLLMWGLIISVIFGVGLMLVKKVKSSHAISMAPFFLAGTVITNAAVLISYIST